MLVRKPQCREGGLGAHHDDEDPDKDGDEVSEEEIAELFDRCSGTNFVRFGVTIESKQQHKEPAPIIAEKDDVQPPIIAEKDDDQSVHAPFFAWPKQAYAGEYEDDEPVGCNGESTYLGEENDDARPKNNVDPVVVAKRVSLGTLDVDNSYDPQHVKGDDGSLIANNVSPTYIHDKNNPRIKVGATFMDSQAFKVTLRQVAIREAWSFDTEYSEPKRFSAKCKDKNCPWRIHASKIKNTKTFMVKKLPFGHTCGTANCSKGMANRDSLADKGRAALQEDATVSARQLKKRLQRDYDTKLQYSDVWKGRARAKDQLEGIYKENFQLLWSFRAELLAANPGSIFEIDIKTTKGIRSSRGREGKKKRE
ncbi:hypothetical protein ACQ4PT_054042 [Festuca glaucescens]